MRRLVVIFVVAAGCGGPSSYNQFRDQLTSSWCDRQVRCGEVAADDTQHCGVPAPLSLTLRGLVDVPSSIAAHHMIFHPDNARECLDAVKNAPCAADQASDDFYRHCHGVVTGGVDNGSACLGDDECVGGLCAGAGCGLGVCTPYAAHGAPCVASGGTPDQTCDPTVMFCNVERGVCEHKLARGGVCAFDAMCLFDTVCVNGTCDDPPRVKDGDLCTNGAVPCVDGDYCDGTCKPLLDGGQACNPQLLFADPCKPGMTCTNGTCAPWSGVPISHDKVGPLARCSSNDDCDAGLYCAVGGYCYYTSGVGALCPSGRECLPSLMCVDGTCARPVSCGPPAT